MSDFNMTTLTIGNLTTLSNLTATESTVIDSSLEMPAPYEPSYESSFEYWTDTVIGLAFFGTAFIAAQRMSTSRSQGGAETTVVTAFYTLILLTSSLRALWFLIPNSVMQPSYTPSGVMAFSETYPSWFGAFLSEEILSFGSLCLFSIFILILVYWADILKKYFYPGARRSKPMAKFITIVAVLIGIQFINCLAFLFGKYSTEAMILINAIVLALVSVVCVFEISIFSHRFRTVLKTLGAINQVSTESQVKRIVWITVTGNAFFATRASLEVWFSATLLIFWHQHGSVDKVFSHDYWDSYVLLKYVSEFAILCLMLYILKSRFSTSGNEGASRGDYAPIPESEQAGGGATATVNSAVAV